MTSLDTVLDSGIDPFTENGARSTQINRICVVHLARATNGTGPLRAFLDSYRAHPAGVAHELLIVFKGFRQPLEPAYEELLIDVSHARRFVDDRGLDVDVYFDTARAIQADAFCFLNSFSVILSDRWLSKLSHALTLDGIGLVGASGTWQSHSYGYLPPEWIAAAIARRAPWKRLALRLFPWLKPLRNLPKTWRWRGFDPFPNYHVRTNAFMLRAEIGRRIRLTPTRNKFDAWMFESGKTGLTRQVLGMARRATIVDAQGRVYEMADWYASNTFWRAQQEGLLIADNQSRAYDQADLEGRRLYSTYAWGPMADPGTSVP